MPQRLYKDEPLTPEERAAYEEDLISFCDHELDLLGDVEGLNVLYAGGSSLLWLEGLSQRIGRKGTLIALDIDPGRVEERWELLPEADLAAPVRLLTGDVFCLPFPPGTFDLVYSAGLFHELDVSEKPARDALAALASIVRSDGCVATSDFIDSVPAVQLEDEELWQELVREASGGQLYGIGPPDRLVGLHEALLVKVRWQISPSQPIRYLDKLVLAEEEPEGLSSLPTRMRRRLRQRRERLRERVQREGYTRPATLYVEGFIESQQAISYQ